MKNRGKRIFIFHTRDTFWIEEQMQKIIALHHENGEKSSIIRLIFPEDSPKKAIDSLNTLFFSKEKTIVSIKNYDQKMAKKELIQLLDACGKNSLLFLHKEMAKFNSKAFEEEVRKRSEVEICVEYFVKEERISHRLKKFSEETNIFFDDKAREKLLFFFSKNPMLWKSEMSKIALYFHGSTEKVNANKLNILIHWPESETSEFFIVDQLALQKKEGLLMLEKYLEQRGNFLMIIVLLQREFKKILQFKELLAQKHHQEKVFQILSIYYTKEKNALLRYNQIYTIQSSLRMLEGLIEIEKILKSEDFNHTAVGQTSFNWKAKLYLYRLFSCITNQHSNAF